MLSRFFCKISNVSCTNLLSMDSNGLSDPYVNFVFDSNFLKFSTPTIQKSLNPKWKNWKKEFIYETKFPRSLHKKFFQVDVFDKDLYSSDDFIGTVKVPIHQLASGARFNTFQLTSKQATSAGEITFEFDVRQLEAISVRFLDLRMYSIDGDYVPDGDATGKYFLKVTPKVDSDVSVEPKSVKTDTSDGLVNPEFNEIEKALVFPGLSLKRFLTQKLKVEAWRKKGLGGLKIGEKVLRLSQILKTLAKDTCKVTMKVGTSAGMVTAGVDITVKFENLPLYMQLKGGVNTNGKSSGTIPIPGVRLPAQYVKKTMSIPETGKRVVNEKRSSSYTNTGGSLESLFGKVKTPNRPYSTKGMSLNTGFSPKFEFQSFNNPTGNTNTSNTNLYGSNQSMVKTKQNQPNLYGNTKGMYKPNQPKPSYKLPKKVDGYGGGGGWGNQNQKKVQRGMYNVKPNNSNAFTRFANYQKQQEKPPVYNSSYGNNKFLNYAKRTTNNSGYQQNVVNQNSFVPRQQQQKPLYNPSVPSFTNQRFVPQQQQKPIYQNKFVNYANTNKFVQKKPIIYSNVKPMYSNVKPIYANVKPMYSNVRPIYTNVKPMYSNVQYVNQNNVRYVNPNNMQQQQFGQQQQYGNFNPNYYKK